MPILLETSYQVSRGKRMAALAEIELLKLRRVRAEMQHGRDVESLMTQQLTAFKIPDSWLSHHQACSHDREQVECR